MSLPFDLTDEKRNKIKEMAEAGISVKIIAEVIGTTPRTMHRRADIRKIYNTAHNKIRISVGANLLARVQSPKADAALLIFFAKIWLGWGVKHSEGSELKGDILDKLYQLDKDYNDGKISEESWLKMSAALIARWKAEDQEERLAKVEKALKIKAKKQKNSDT